METERSVLLLLSLLTCTDSRGLREAFIERQWQFAISFICTISAEICMNDSPFLYLKKAVSK